MIPRIAGWHVRWIDIKMDTRDSLINDGACEETCHIPIYPALTVDPQDRDSYSGQVLEGISQTGDLVEASLLAQSRAPSAQNTLARSTCSTPLNPKRKSALSGFEKMWKSKRFKQRIINETVLDKGIVWN